MTRSAYERVSAAVALTACSLALAAVWTARSLALAAVVVALRVVRAADVRDRLAAAERRWVLAAVPVERDAVGREAALERLREVVVVFLVVSAMIGWSPSQMD